MIVLDTNVVSELLRAQPNPNVLRWYSLQTLAQLHITSITQAEMLLGVALLGPGKRKDGLQQSMQHFFERDFGSLALPFDHKAADAYAQITASRRAAGRPIMILDAQIAAICSATGASIATRDVTDFADCGLDLINPWLD